MTRGNAARFISACVWVAAFALLAPPAVTADVVAKGTLTVDGKAVAGLARTMRCRSRSTT